MSVSIVRNYMQRARQQSSATTSDITMNVLLVVPCLLLFQCTLICKASVTVQPCEALACCELTKAELTACQGTSKRCPGFVGVKYLNGAAKTPALDECNFCEPGECRVGTTCTCPEDFLGNKDLQKACEDAYADAWPKSVNNPNEKCTGAHNFPDPSPPSSDEPDVDASAIAPVASHVNETDTLPRDVDTPDSLRVRRSKSAPGIIAGAFIAVIAGVFYIVMRCRRR